MERRFNSGSHFSHRSGVLTFRSAVFPLRDARFCVREQSAVRWYFMSHHHREVIRMTIHTYRSSRPDGWVMPRPHSDPHLRRMHYGRIQPMEQPKGFFARLWNAR